MTAPAPDQAHWSEAEGWGPWHLEKSQGLLWTDACGGGHHYAIQLSQLTTSAGVLFWISHIANKAWGHSQTEHDRIVVGLIDAIEAICDPAANLCPGGTSKRMGLAQLRERVAIVDQAA